MTRDTNLFQDAWTGWVSFVREIGGRPSRLKTTRLGGADLKPVGKLPIKVPLKRDLAVIRRPQPKRAKSVTKRLEAPLLRREPAEDVPKLKVDPPKPFKLAEEFLETPPERVSRLEKRAKKKAAPEEGGGLAASAAYYPATAAPALLECWYTEGEGASPKLPPGWGVTQVGRAFRRVSPV